VQVWLPCSPLLGGDARQAGGHGATVHVYGFLLVFLWGEMELRGEFHARNWVFGIMNVRTKGMLG
jgi:hypothetical protein